MYKVFKTVPGTLYVLATTNITNTNTLRNVGREKCLWMITRTLLIMVQNFQCKMYNSKMVIYSISMSWNIMQTLKLCKQFVNKKNVDAVMC